MSNIPINPAATGAPAAAPVAPTAGQDGKGPSAVAHGAPSPAKKASAAVAPVMTAAQELEVLIRARYPIIYVTTWEEERIERYLREIAKRREKNLFVWTITDGIVKAGTEPSRNKLGGGSTADPLAALDAVLSQIEPAIYLFKDFHHFTDDQRCNLTVIRRLRDAAHQLRDTY